MMSVPNGRRRLRRPLTVTAGVVALVVAALVSGPAARTPAVAASVSGPITGIGGKCLDNAGGATSNGNPVQLWTCDGLSRQQWTLPGDGTIRVQGNHCLAVKGAGVTEECLKPVDVPGRGCTFPDHP